MLRSHRRVFREVREAPGSPGGLLCTVYGRGNGRRNGRHNGRSGRRNHRRNDSFSTKIKTIKFTPQIGPNYENFTLNRKIPGKEADFEDSEERILCEFFKNFCRVKNLQ